MVIFGYSLPVIIAMYNGRTSCDAINGRSYSVRLNKPTPERKGVEFTTGAQWQDLTAICTNIHN